MLYNGLQVDESVHTRHLYEHLAFSKLKNIFLLHTKM